MFVIIGALRETDTKFEKFDIAFNDPFDAQFDSLSAFGVSIVVINGV